MIIFASLKYERTGEFETGSLVHAVNVVTKQSSCGVVANSLGGKVQWAAHLDIEPNCTVCRRLWIERANTIFENGGHNDVVNDTEPQKECMQ